MDTTLLKIIEEADTILNNYHDCKDALLNIQSDLKTLDDQITSHKILESKNKN